MTGPAKNPGYESPKGTNALVTGSSGFVGSRLVEMLLERGTKTVVAFDISAPDPVLQKRFEDIQAKTGGKIIVLAQTEGDLCSASAVASAFDRVDTLDIVYHIAALVGPFHSRDMYYKVNYEGTLKIIENCKRKKVPKLVYSSSPSTRFTGEDVAGLKGDEMPIVDQFIELYAETKAKGEQAVHKACSDDLLTISVAPHQVYGPHDPLFLPKLMETAGNGLLRVFGKGENKVSLCYNDNYCHGLMCGADALYPKSPALAKFYVITDDEPQVFWKILNQAAVAMGFEDLFGKFHLPVALLMTIAYICKFLTLLTGKKFKLTPFTVRMMIIHRYFDISNSKKDLQYEPLISFEKGWPQTIEWFKANWLPEFKNKGASEL